ncbi:cupin domain-containing protein [Kordiimonas sp.]|uniref:cupin domain-containing protein n=1 Tax=Kordiimonas sp. TaxID=1970157 RepID=UPI003A8DCE0F
MRRIVTGETNAGRSTIILDAPSGFELGGTNRSGIHEIWTENLTQMLTPQDQDTDRHFEDAPTLSPPEGVLKVRWFVVNPLREADDPGRTRSAFRNFFREIGAENNLTDQKRNPSMHQTESFDVVCLLSGKASLILDDCETELSVGQVVIQRGTSHAWVAHDGPALFLALLIGRKVSRP